MDYSDAEDQSYKNRACHFDLLESNEFLNHTPYMATTCNGALCNAIKCIVAADGDCTNVIYI